MHSGQQAKDGERSKSSLDGFYARLRAYAHDTADYDLLNQ
jgi:hypothetical protein